MDYIIAIIGGGVGAAIVSVVGSLLLARQARRYAEQDAESADIKAMKAGMKWLLYDRIRHVGMKYIEDGCVDFDDRRILGEMWNVYHHGLEGNGDLDDMMKAVRALPLKKEGKA